MHFVFLNQYYPPDAAPTGVMLEGLVEELVRDGHEVTVLCASGGYAGREKLKTEKLKAEMGESDLVHSPTLNSLSRHSPMATPDQPSTSAPRIIRLRASRFGRGTFIGKLLDYASYYVGVAWRLLTLRPAPDRIVALTTPPFLSVLARLFSKIRGADHAHWVMDLYPDVMAAHGMLGEESPAYRILAGLARWGFGGRRCAAVLTLGPDMAERVGKVISDQSSECGASVSELGEAGEAAILHGRRQIRKDKEGDEDIATPRDSQLTSVQWVPLWGVEVISDQSSECGVSVSELGEAGEAAILHGRRQIREEKAGDEDMAATHDSQPSTLNSQLASDPHPSASSAALRRKRGWADGELIVMYSGNMGLGHRFGEILAAAGRVREELSVVSDPLSVEPPRGAMAPRTTVNRQPTTPELSPRFVFFGDGKRRVEVEAFVRENPGCGVELHGYAPAEELAAHLRSADVHLASLDAAWTGTMVPSKLQGIFAAGRPVIFIGSADSSIGQWVAESGGGWLVPAGDVDGLLAALDEARDPQVRLTRGRAAKGFSDRHFDKRTNVARVAAVLIGRTDAASL